MRLNCGLLYQALYVLVQVRNTFLQGWSLALLRFGLCYHGRLVSFHPSTSSWDAQVPARRFLCCALCRMTGWLGFGRSDQPELSRDNGLSDHGIFQWLWSGHLPHCMHQMIVFLIALYHVHRCSVKFRPELRWSLGFAPDDWSDVWLAYAYDSILYLVGAIFIHVLLLFV